jgi:hypothetical protein
MHRTVGNYDVELKQIAGVGTPWIVRVYKKMMFFRRRVSSDWFLDEQQATTFAEEIVRELGRNSSGTIKDRKPGWTLHRAR